MSWENSDYYINIEDTIEQKITALRKHRSQIKDWDPGELLRGWAEESGRGKEMKYAEGYRVVTLIDDETWESSHNKQPIDPIKD